MKIKKKIVLLQKKKKKDRNILLQVVKEHDEPHVFSLPPPSEVSNRESTPAFSVLHAFVGSLYLYILRKYNNIITLYRCKYDKYIVIK